MKCPFCGYENSYDARFCSNCGRAQFTAGNSSHTAAGNSGGYAGGVQGEANSSWHMNENANGTQTMPSSQFQTVASSPRPGMKWYHFVVKVQLWIYMAVALINGIMVFTGAHYGGQTERDAVYLIYPDMKAVDIIYGIVMLGLVAFAFVTRKSLALYEERGPKSYIYLNVITAIHPLLYLTVSSLVANVPLGDLINSSTVGQFLSGITLAIINTVYFRKRKDLFTN